MAQDLNGVSLHDPSSVLPDPTKDLNWSAFRGAIQDIFSRNAERHPTRTCVVETATACTSARSFAYGQIHGASNILAHHLLASNVSRGETVMIYAHRGVDLVVAILGVLKAGATFSVIDPAYPPDRQIIYLDVARPRALVAIEAAIDEAGELSPKIQAYIKETLQLRTTIPRLRLHADGRLQGGEIDGQDVLAPQTGLAARSPAILVGPDSNPTLSFTSGSEGRPKGVLGRHFSLTYYVPWMRETFHLSEDDRFTMLSGIAHDPIQRDIFTPLFLGAQLLIPAKEDIQNERLAEWMRAHRATVTHLTPAMGQILVGGASAEFPDLHHAFFVGDLLIKRDCRALQRLAPNARIVNMYGSTETQRAVSYYEIPSRVEEPEHLDRLTDVIPAGKGMVDVQLLVVDRADPSRLCELGVVGEIYVRAGGLAEGYLGLPDLTDSKFVKNWFLDPHQWIDEDRARVAKTGPEEWRECYQGPRDRLYKTGDLGRYTADGNVECCGRVDSQVKIRGFRVELGEIDTFLSQHPLVRENVTLARRGKEGDLTLVSYVVPNMSAWRTWLDEQGLEHPTAGDDMVGRLVEFRHLRDQVRTFLRGKLPVHAVPPIFVPLERMPLNPNGKVDKPALPYPDAAQLAAAAAAVSNASGPSHTSFSDTERAVAEIWAGILPDVHVESIGLDESFFDLGGHSILAQQMIFAVGRRWKGIGISMNAIFRSPALRAFAAEIDRRQSGGVTPAMTNGGPDVNQSSDDHATEGSPDVYAADARRLAGQLPERFAAAADYAASPAPFTVFLTGATGFLGAYLLQDLFAWSWPVTVIAHVRADDPAAALERVRQSCQAYGVWSATWSSRIRCVTGSLGEARLGLSTAEFDRLAAQVDVVIHNGAQVHWVYPYEHMKAANVLGTIDSLRLCAAGKAKRYVFVSSTSVLDAPHYLRLSEEIVAAGGAGIPEADDLEGSCQGLGTGYGQSKWVAEYLVREAGRRGLRGAIVRPGYVLGDSHTGVTNTDDFLIRLLKACVQLGARPDLAHTINMVPVNHVARTIVSAALCPPVSPLGVVHVTAHPRLTFNDFLGTLNSYGYHSTKVDYPRWRTLFEQHVAAATITDGPGGEANALLPLYHFVTSDLPANTQAPELDDAHAALALKADPRVVVPPTRNDVFAGAAVTEDLMGLYLAYLVAIGFMPHPPQAVTGDDPDRGRAGARGLPTVRLSEEQSRALGKLQQQQQLQRPRPKSSSERGPGNITETSYEGGENDDDDDDDDGDDEDDDDGNDDDQYFAHERVPLPLPPSDLLQAIHAYAADFYAAVAGGGTGRGRRSGEGGDWRSLDETALLALGVLLEEEAGAVLGETGDLVFVEEEEEEEDDDDQEDEEGEEEGKEKDW
ncbi:MAG: large subunit of alpha-aminoadipate reductase [Phylliscum demangeonii]|nr:MAG: large subunit of alpha-aminoadipate reductase [Phylliscum demangeonii]